jgi:hypothetical protein
MSKHLAIAAAALLAACSSPVDYPHAIMVPPLQGDRLGVAQYCRAVGSAYRNQAVTSRVEINGAIERHATYQNNLCLAGAGWTMVSAPPLKEQPMVEEGTGRLIQPGEPGWVAPQRIVTMDDIMRGRAERLHPDGRPKY